MVFYKKMQGIPTNLYVFRQELSTFLYVFPFFFYNNILLSKLIFIIFQLLKLRNKEGHTNKKNIFFLYVNYF